MSPTEFRRKAVSFDAYTFEKLKNKGHTFDLFETFKHIHDINLWGSNTSKSGVASSAPEISHWLAELPKLLAKYQINSVLDAPCGDRQWISTLDWSKRTYMGIDLFEPIHMPTQFIQGDMITLPLPQVDLILCRDAWVHFSYADIWACLRNFKRSNSEYLLTTTFTDTTSNQNIVTGDWQTLNLQLPPFNFPSPVFLINENCTQNNGLYSDKSLGLWKLSDISLT